MFSKMTEGLIVASLSQWIIWKKIHTHTHVISFSCKFMRTYSIPNVKGLVNHALEIYNNGYSGPFIFVAEARIDEARKINSRISSSLHFRDAYAGRFSIIIGNRDKIAFPISLPPNRILISFLSLFRISLPDATVRSLWIHQHEVRSTIRVISIDDSTVESIPRSADTRNTWTSLMSSEGTTSKLLITGPSSPSARRRRAELTSSPSSSTLWLVSARFSGPLMPCRSSLAFARSTRVLWQDRTQRR